MRSGRASRERGAAAVEFALVLPIALALVGLVLFAGWIGAVRAVVEHGAEAGARYAAVPGPPDLRTYPEPTSVAAYVDEHTPFLTPTTVEVFTPRGTLRNAPLTVRVSYTVPNPMAVFATPLRGLGAEVPETVTVRAAATERLE